jgi:hypothetical protein
MADFHRGLVRVNLVVRVLISHVLQFHVYHSLSFRETLHSLNEVGFLVLEETLLVLFC